MNRRTERGSVIIWILIAVGLFAALGFAFSQGSRTSSNMLTNEQARAYAQQIIAYGNDMKQAVKRMTLGGINGSAIGFDNTVFKYMDGSLVNPSGHNPNCTTENCMLFSPSGGQMNPVHIPESAVWYDSALDALPAGTRSPGSWRPYILNMDGLGTSDVELAIIGLNVSRQICLKINDALGIQNPSGLPPSLPGGSNQAYIGQDFSVVMGVWGNFAPVTGKKSYCYTLDGAYKDKFYNYVTVLIEN